MRTSSSEADGVLEAFTTYCWRKGGEYGGGLEGVVEAPPRAWATRHHSDLHIHVPYYLTRHASRATSPDCTSLRFTTMMSREALLSAVSRRSTITTEYVLPTCYCTCSYRRHFLSAFSISPARVSLTQRRAYMHQRRLLHFLASVETETEKPVASAHWRRI